MSRFAETKRITKFLSATCLMLAGFVAPITAQECFETSCCGKSSDSSCAGGSCNCGCVSATHDLWTATQLTGDWGGARTNLTDHGITFSGSLTQFYQGVTSGGREQKFEYNGHGDYVLDFDFGKMDVQEGLLLRLRAEHRFGDTINAATGLLLPPSMLSDLPDTTTEDLVLTNVLFTQFLSESFAVFFGKLDTLSNRTNAFADGRGDDRFMNGSLVFPSTSIATVPYSTLGAGFILFEEQFPVFQFSVLNARDTITTSGFDELFENGVSLAGQLNVPTNFAELPGLHSFGATWNSQDFVALGQDPRVLIGEVPIAEKTGSWNFYWSGHQYLHLYPCKSQKGWGVFGKAGISDGNPNLLEYFLNFGIGGDSPLRGRAADTFGVGWFYNGLSDERGVIARQFLGLQDETGVELFYNIAVTPSFHLTPDLQIVEPAFGAADTAVIFGLRGQIIL